MDEISRSQSHLTEKLRLLQELGYSDVNILRNHFAAFGLNKRRRDPDPDNELPILDLIAACLSTGKPGDVVAAAFDKREQISLVLAKSGNIDSADYTATHAFLSALKEATLWIDLMPFLATHSKYNVDRRVRRLNESMKDLFDDLQLAATEYNFRSIETEFPKSSHYRKAKYPEAPPTPQMFLRDLMHICTTHSDMFELQNDDEASLVRYVQLSNAADFLRRSLFLRCLLCRNDKQNSGEEDSDEEDSDEEDSDEEESSGSILKRRVERLKRRLDKVCQYATINTLIRLVKRLSNIPFRWIGDDLVGTRERSVEICKDPMEVVEHILGHLPSAEGTEALLQHHSNLCKNWERRPRFVNTHVHPELLLILDLCPPFLSESHRPPIDAVPFHIGCSKRSCLCCMLWINSFHINTGMECMTTRTSGKPCGDWALSGAVGEVKLARADWSEFDKSVVRGVHRRLSLELGSLMPTE